MKHYKPTEKELEILSVLWSNGPSTVRQINDCLSTEKEVGYTTTLKFMQIMHDKNLLSRERNGKNHIYKAEISRSNTQIQLIDRLLETAFDGSAMKMVMQALGNSQSTKKELSEIKKYIEKLEGGEL